MNIALKANTVPACPICLFAWFGLVFCIPCSLFCFFESKLNGTKDITGLKQNVQQNVRQLDTWYIRDHWISNGIHSACTEYNVGLNIVKIEDQDESKESTKKNEAISIQLPGIVEDIEFT